MALPPRVREVAAFLVVGGLSAAIDAGVFLLLTTLGMHPVLASSIGFLSAFVVNFGGNRRLVFRARSAPGQLWRYVALVILNLGLSAGIVALGIAMGLHPTVAKGVSLVLIAAFNFVAMRQWVFRDRSAADRSPTQAGSGEPTTGSAPAQD